MTSGGAGEARGRADARRPRPRGSGWGGSAIGTADSGLARAGVADGGQRLTATDREGHAIDGGTDEGSELIRRAVMTATEPATR
jgi:hypothetical protein